jgi:hypothetical protein
LPIPHHTSTSLRRRSSSSPIPHSSTILQLLNELLCTRHPSRTAHTSRRSRTSPCPLPLPRRPSSAPARRRQGQATLGLPARPRGCCTSRHTAADTRRRPPRCFPRMATTMLQERRAIAATHRRSVSTAACR